MSNEVEQRVLTMTDKRNLEEELKKLRQEKLDVAEEIKIARGHGDLSENAEYDEAKNNEARIYARLAEVERAAARVVRRIRGDEDEPRVLASCRRADGLFTDLQLSGLFGKADQIEQFIHRLPSPFPFLRRRSRGWPCPARARARGICAPA